jgi:hypothetical protein
VTVRGDLDTDTALQLWQYLRYLIGQGHHHIVLDLRGMILIDSAGVEVLARCRLGPAARVASWCCGRPVRPWPSSWSWPGGPRPTGAILPPAAANRPADWRPDRQDHAVDDRVCSELVQQLTLAVLDHPAEGGLRMIRTIRSYLDTWRGFLQDLQELVDHLRATSRLGT